MRALRNYLALLLLLPIMTSAAPGTGYGPGAAPFDCIKDSVDCVVEPLEGQGIRIYDTDAFGGAIIDFYGEDRTTREASVGSNGSFAYFKGYTLGQAVRLEGTTLGNIGETMLQMDPDGGSGAVQMYFRAFPAASAAVYFTHTSISRAWNVDSITDATGTGNYDINFTSGTFGANPVCVCHADNATASTCATRAEYNATRWQITVRVGATATDSIPMNVQCFSTTP